MKRIAVALAVATVAVIGVGYAIEDPVPEARAAAMSPAFGPASFDEALQATARRVEEKRRLHNVMPGEWLRTETLALALIARHRLSGNPDDLAEAGRLLRNSFSGLEDPAGPSLTLAQHALIGHDLPAATEALAKFGRTAVKLPHERSTALALTGDIAFQRGDLAEAERAYDEAARLTPGFATAARRANLQLWRGEPASALAIAEQGMLESRMPPQDHARAALLFCEFLRMPQAISTSQVVGSNAQVKSLRVTG